MILNLKKFHCHFGIALRILGPLQIRSHNSTIELVNTLLPAGSTFERDLETSGKVKWAAEPQVNLGNFDPRRSAIGGRRGGIHPRAWSFRGPGLLVPGNWERTLLASSIGAGQSGNLDFRGFSLLLFKTKSSNNDKTVFNYFVSQAAMRWSYYSQKTFGIESY